MKSTLTLFLTVIGSLLLPVLLTAQEFEVDWFGLAGAGGESVGGDFGLSAMAGQSDAGDAAGGDFTLAGGFWSIASVVEAPSAPTLRVRVDGADLVLSWPQNGGALFQLETSDIFPVPPGVGWSPVNATPGSDGSERFVRLPLAAGQRFYRLHQP